MGLYFKVVSFQLQKFINFLFTEEAMWFLALGCSLILLYFSCQKPAEKGSENFLARYFSVL